MCEEIKKQQSGQLIAKSANHAADCTGGWSSECPTTEGEYWFKDGEGKPCEVEIAMNEPYAEPGLWLWTMTRGLPLEKFHHAQINPQWRPLRGLDDACEGATGNECVTCGLPMSKNPHPDAGNPKRLMEIGAMWECVPCSWGIAMRARDKVRSLETRLAEAERERDVVAREYTQMWRSRDRYKTLADRLGAALKPLHARFPSGDSYDSLEALAELRRAGEAMD